MRATSEASSVAKTPLPMLAIPSRTATDGVIILDQLGQHREMGLQPERGRPGRPDAQQARVDPLLQVEPERPHVTQNLGG